MLDVFLDALLDTLKTLPFLFAAYLLIEFLEHKAGQKLTGALSRMGPLGPMGGAVLGCLPQCGFSVAAANFYAGRLISAGTLLAVFLATSDEALLILLSQPQAFPSVIRLLGVKLIVAAVAGLATDFVLKHFLKPKDPEPFDDLCSHCGCESHGIFRSAAVHTLRILLFIFVVNIVLSFAIYFIGEAAISRFLLSGSVFQPLLAGLIGFIPNCAASIILTELYLAGSLSFGSAVTGLCTGAGLGLAVLFKLNKNHKENFAIAGVLYVVAVVAGVACNFIFGIHPQ